MATQNQRILSSFLMKFMVIMTLMMGVSACQSTVTQKTSIDAAATVGEDTAPEVVETGPEYVEGLGFRMTWAKTDASLVTAPQDIKNEALALCQEKGFVRSFMRQIAFSTDKAEAFFGCTGASSN